MKRISVNISDDLYDRISIRTEEGKPVSWQVRDDLEAYYQRLKRDMDRKRRFREDEERDGTGQNVTPDCSSSALSSNALRTKALSIKAFNASNAVAFTAEGFDISAERLKAWKLAYPAVDVEREVRHAHEWILANPKNHKSNYHRYLVNWLSKAQDRAPRVQVESVKVRAAIQDMDGPVTPMPAEIREQMRKIVDGIKMP